MKLGHFLMTSIHHSQKLACRCCILRGIIKHDASLSVTLGQAHCDITHWLYPVGHSMLKCFYNAALALHTLQYAAQNMPDALQCGMLHSSVRAPL